MPLIRTPLPSPAPSLGHLVCSALCQSRVHAQASRDLVSQEDWYCSVACVFFRFTELLVTGPERVLPWELPLVAGSVSGTQHVTRQICKVTCSPCGGQVKSPGLRVPLAWTRRQAWLYYFLALGP